MTDIVKYHTIEQAAKTLKQGGVVVFPTDTVYGIGCRMDNVRALNRLNKLLKRPSTQPFPVLVNSQEMGEIYLQALPKKVAELMRQNWPGPLTVVYYCKTELVPRSARGGGDTLGVRMPDHVVPLQLIDEIKKPLIGTSANFHGARTPCNFDDLNKRLLQMVDGVVLGECKLKKASTVIDCTGTHWKILRAGATKR